MLSALAQITGGLQIGMDGENYAVLENGIWRSATNDEITKATTIAEETSNNERVVKIKAKANEIITAKYPTHTQLNIMRAGGEALSTMSAYIDGIREQSNTLEADTTKTAEDFIDG